MKIETQFSIGDFVYTVESGHVVRVDHPDCPLCSKTETPGEVDISGERFQCPKCNGKKTVRVERYGWWVSGGSTIGQVTVTVTEDDDPDAPEDERNIRYMLRSTGIGSGTCWAPDRVFASREEAQAHCDARNT